MAINLQLIFLDHLVIFTIATALTGTNRNSTMAASS
ncbi:hypothetical protein Xbud_03415 [Xenorhabdus budapestensis]|uniref:Uncharacterized protein n=1 Tax=Xenorhabdus budapestensis TaxID=290110 RepID=A0A2D0IQD8_XENBU|nr:hypothetical protein Xbud_03415 [Xenorhabdus budapestensis]